MIARSLLHAYRGFLLNGLRGRGKLVEASAFLPSAWRQIELTFDSGVVFKADMGRRLHIPLLDTYFRTMVELEALQRWIAVAMRPGDVFWDVGGNVGTVSVHFAHERFAQREIHLFEPNPGLASHLCSLFEGTRVRVHSVGVGDREEMLKLHIPQEGSSIASFVNTGSAPAEKLVEVPVYRGDTLCREQGIPAPDVIKIDVEGFEPQVIRGLQETIRTVRPIIFLEYLFLSNEECLELVPEGYHYFLISDQGELMPGMERREIGHNMVLLPDEKAQGFVAGAFPSKV